MTPSVDQLLADDRLERVPSDPPTAQAMVEEAQRHLKSANRLVKSDPGGAYAMLYDAARKAVAAHMLASGYRARNRTGAHEVVALYAEERLTQRRFTADVRQLDRMRRSRNQSEYLVRAFGRAEIEKDLAHSRAIVEAVEADWPA